MTREGPSIEIRGRPGEVAVELPETPTSGYLWSLDRSAAGVEEIGRDYREGGAEPLAGGSGIRSFRLRVPAPGSYQLEFVLKRPWEADALEHRNVALILSR